MSRINLSNIIQSSTGEGDSSYGKTSFESHTSFEIVCYDVDIANIWVSVDDVKDKPIKYNTIKYWGGGLKLQCFHLASYVPSETKNVDRCLYWNHDSVGLPLSTWISWLPLAVIPIGSINSTRVCLSVLAVSPQSVLFTRINFNIDVTAFVSPC